MTSRRSVPPSLRPSRAPRPDPRSEGGEAPRTEVARTTLDALHSSSPEEPALDREARLERLVRELSRAGPEADEPLRRRAIASGPEVLPLVAASFPGLLWIDLSLPHRPLRNARNLSALCMLLLEMKESAVPLLPQLLSADDVEARICAALLCVDFPYGALVKPLAAALHDKQPAVRDSAMLALRALGELPELQALRGELIATLRRADASIDEKTRAVWSLGALREPQSVPALIDALALPATVAARAREALTRLTGRDLGRYRFRWSLWWRGRKAQSRVDWLLDAIDQRDELGRVRALEELLLWTGQPLPDGQGIETRDRARTLQSILRQLVTPLVAPLR